MDKDELVKLLADHMTGEEIAAADPDSLISTPQQRLDILIAEARTILSRVE